MPEPQTKPVLRCLARAVGSRDEWSEIRVRARSVIQLEAILRRRGLKMMQGSAEAVPNGTASTEAELRSVAPGPLGCWNCGASLNNHDLEQNARSTAAEVTCNHCTQPNEVVEFIPDPLSGIDEKTFVAKPVVGCPGCGYDLRGQCTHAGGVRCPECGRDTVLMVRDSGLHRSGGARPKPAANRKNRSRFSVRCRACDYPLANITPKPTSDDRSTITCPECGEHNPLSILSLRDVDAVEAPGGRYTAAPAARLNTQATILCLLVVLSPFTMFALWVVTLPWSGAIIARHGGPGWGLLGMHAVVFAVTMVVLFSWY